MGLLLAQQCPLSSSGLRDPAAAICTIPLSPSDELPKYTARVLGENEPLHGASFPGTTCPVVSPVVAAVYVTLRRQSTRFRCRTLASSPSTLHVSWARTSPCTEPRFQEPTRSCFLLAFYTKLSQSSTRVWPVILTSVRSPVGTGRDAAGFQRQASKLCSPVFTQNKHYENSLVNPTYAGCELSFTPGLSSLLLVTSVCFPSFL